jgi:protein O-mannosyl-transferase
LSERGRSTLPPSSPQRLYCRGQFNGLRFKSMFRNCHRATREHQSAAAIFVLALAIAWLAYSPGIGGTLQFDDYPNLGGLSKVVDADSAFRFIATGGSGPLGRPIALASFVPQAYAWPDLPGEFLRINILIHLLNGALVAWFLYLLALARGSPEKQAALTGTASSAIWMLLPILASSTLMTVQRMTTLSATFVLIAAIAYFYARRSSSSRPVLALSGMTLAIGIGATLAAFTKENGILLVVFLFATEATLLHRPQGVSRRVWRIWFTLLLVIPTTTLLIYLTSHLSYSDAMLLKRDFNGIERLLTQAEILWKYLFHAFLPNPANLGPFHDNHSIQRNILNFSTLLAVAAWIGVIFSAVYFRRKAPLFSFAVGWFLLGHALESTSIPLELYFEHRNYLPLIGPVFAVVSLAMGLAIKWWRIVAFASISYLVLLGTVLYGVTSLWGSPRVGAEVWHGYNPGSTRAVQHFAGQLERNGHFFASQRLLTGFLQANPDAHDVRFQLLHLACVLQPNAEHGDAITDLEHALYDARYIGVMEIYMRLLYADVLERRCPSITDEALYRLGKALIENPNYNVPDTKHHILLVLAQIQLQRGDLQRAMDHLQEALAIYPNLLTLDVLVSVQDNAGLYDLSRETLDGAKNWMPRQPLKAKYWRQQMDKIEYFRRETFDSLAVEQ